MKKKRSREKQTRGTRPSCTCFVRVSVEIVYNYELFLETPYKSICRSNQTITQLTDVIFEGESYTLRLNAANFLDEKKKLAVLCLSLE